MLLASFVFFIMIGYAELQRYFIFLLLARICANPIYTKTELPVYPVSY